MNYRRLAGIGCLVLGIAVLCTGCHKVNRVEEGTETVLQTAEATLEDLEVTESESVGSEGMKGETAETTLANPETTASGLKESETKDSDVTATESESVLEIVETLEMEEISFDMDWEYAEFSAINNGVAMFYPAKGPNVKGITVCVNAGHGTKGGSSYSTYSHPDKSPKCTGGTNANGAVKSMAIAEGTTMDDGTPESVVTLKLAKIVKDDLLAAGYHVLMIRESENVQLDNIARTVIANNNADCHIALHYDGTSKDKGAFYIAVPDIDSYRSMEPVASMWKKHNKLGRCLVDGLDDNGVAIWSSGEMELDLTQTSYSTIPSVDLEVGDQASDYGEGALRKISAGIVEGLDAYWE